MARDDFIQVRVNSTAKAELQQLATECDLPLSTIIRHCITKGFPLVRKELSPLKRGT